MFSLAKKVTLMLTQYRYYQHPPSQKPRQTVDSVANHACIDSNEDYQTIKFYSKESRRKPGNKISLEQKILNANNVIKKAHITMHNLMLEIMHGEDIYISEIHQLAQTIYEEVQTNSEALLFCSRQKRPEHYTVMRSISFCALLLNFAKYLQFKPEEMIEIAVGGLLHDIGKMWISQGLINKPGKLNREEFAYIKDHIAFTHLILLRLRIDNPIIRDIALKHHERIDGSGYPDGLQESELSRVAQMAMIVDVYDALTSERCYKHALEPFQALRYIAIQKSHKFNQELVQQFIKCIGLFPLGSLVKLRSGLVGIVLAQTEKLLYPIIKAVYDSKRNRYVTPKTIDTNDLVGHSISGQLLKSVSSSRYPIHVKQYLL